MPSIADRSAGGPCREAVRHAHEMHDRSSFADLARNACRPAAPAAVEV